MQPQPVQKSTEERLGGAASIVTNAQRSSLIDYWWGQWQLSLPPGQYDPDIIQNATYTLGCALQRDHPPPKVCSRTLPSTAPSLSSPRDGLKV